MQKRLNSRAVHVHLTGQGRDGIQVYENAVNRDLDRDLKYILSHDDGKLLACGQNTCRLAAIVLRTSIRA